jgi:glyoxylase-like metal-dependent hydrolase (beta-lactamase superfamily II)
MDSPTLIRDSGTITDYIDHIDLLQYNSQHICSAFLIKTPESVSIMDCGTSNDVSTVLTYIRDVLKISLEQIQYLIPSHYHFDHFGGGWKLWEELVKQNPDVKILSTKLTQDLLQNPNLHMHRARRTFGDFIGEMKPPSDNAFEIIAPETDIHLKGLPEEMKFSLLKTPGHTPDHVSPVLSENGKTSFVFMGESGGTLMYTSKLMTLGTSMPPDFNYSSYIKSLEKIISLNPSIIGFSHFGAVYGRENSTITLQENLSFSSFFRDFVRDKFLEQNETKYVVEEFVRLELGNRVEPEQVNDPFFRKVIVALVYGQLIDLGLRDPK